MTEQQMCGYCGYLIESGQAYFHHSKWGLVHLDPCAWAIERAETSPQWKKDGYEAESEWLIAQRDERIADLERRVESLERSLKAAYDTMYSVTGG